MDVIDGGKPSALSESCQFNSLKRSLFVLTSCVVLVALPLHLSEKDPSDGSWSSAFQCLSSLPPTLPAGSRNRALS
ncbi:hypothetical protein SISNIDRAFT_30573 [Sistotremastrum niveocremeum HHB9708]|uniref:Uncharacterized protein n=1 Tax=Sistotremastrum niveocremeum HHB9708 TaxID=1314777 RepID=A0A164W572_9AGAM|nr:hypothetical protein SISNIDRAFT_30573 [Sistotremastrum niveocremeum HHB9708]